MSFFFPLQELPNNYLHLRLNVRAMRVGRRGHDKARHISKERLPHSASEHLKHMYRILNMEACCASRRSYKEGKLLSLRAYYPVGATSDAVWKLAGRTQ